MWFEGVLGVVLLFRMVVGLDDGFLVEGLLLECPEVEQVFLEVIVSNLMQFSVMTSCVSRGES